ncbi:terminase gpA endonuclease subunit [Sphingomonas sp. CFBP 8760]|uniref:terminase gpA endonuclease subunit n=1 Tax=Sphingomonas sp. CFBP 8760 TaxID=2775282 RepID=UPI0017806540|nr:terminase gpA endonuclease subunit [Sphingomonas sp. CFBP 8760]MBD8548017.1 phage terminase large subunit family protein [Sphingomonas sp. CFBP 8760]
MASHPRLGALALLKQQTREPPRFGNARLAIRRAVAEVRFPEKITPIEAANRHRHLRNPGAYSGPWRDSPEPMQHLVEPTNNLAMTSTYAIIAVIGPSQMGKSEVGNNWQVHSVIYDPADMAFYAPTKELTASYVTTQINKLLEECEDVSARQLGTASADNIYLKQFRGCDWHFLWPTGPNFRARPFSRGRLDDYDDFDDDIGDQGDAVSLFEGRTTSFQGYGWKLYVNSSPKKGPKRGIEPLVVSGTSKRWWVDCQKCSEPFEMAWERLSFERGGTALQAAETAELCCPTCGGAHKQADKPALMATGRWVGKGEDAVSWSTGSNSGKIGDLEPNSIDSYWWDGTFGLAPWSSLARQYRTAELRFEDHQDEGPLKSFFQTKVGRNYVARSTGDAPVTEDMLVARAKQSTYSIRQVPDGVVALTATVDLGVDRFSVMIVGHGVGNRAWIIDRFDILTLGDGITKVEPFARREHWSVLYDKVLRRKYPLQRDSSLLVPIFCTGVDTGGSDDATDNAYAWWHDMVTGSVKQARKPVPATAITLLKGGNRPNGRLLPAPTVDAKRQVKGAPECELFVPNVNRVKIMADHRMRRPLKGPGFIDLPREFAEPAHSKHVAELRAEEQVEGIFVKPEGVRNESWDLLVYSIVVMLRLVGLDQNLGRVPAWARPPRPAAPAIAEPPTAENDDGSDPSPPTPASSGPRVVQASRPAQRGGRSGARRGVRVVRST